MRFSRQMIIFANKNCLVSSFLTHISRIAFSGLIAPDKVLTTNLSRSYDSGHDLLLVLGECIQPCTMKVDIRCRVFIDAYEQVEEGLLQAFPSSEVFVSNE